MKKLISLVGILAASFAAQGAFAQGFTFDLMHTTPVCKHAGHASSWCDGKTDRVEMAERSGMEKRIGEMLDEALKNPSKSKVVIAYFSFSNAVVKDKLCELGKAGVQIEGFFDSNGGLPGDPTSASTYLSQNCQAQGKSNVTINYLAGTQTPWRLHHNKFLIIDTGGKNVRVNFSSGNLSSFGLSLHFDHWVMASAPRSSNFVSQHFCVVDAMKTALAKPIDVDGKQVDDPKVYRTSLEKCLVSKKTLWKNDSSWVENAIHAEGIAPLFSPDPKDNNATVLIEQINSVRKGGRIYGAIQHFTHSDIAYALRQAVKRGVKVSLVMDDDVVSGDSEVPGVAEFFNQNLSAKSGSGIEIRFLETNHGAGGNGQMMHNKFLVLEDVGQKGVDRVFSGAGHFTGAAMRKNYENFYLSQVDSLTKEYAELYKFMADVAKPEVVATKKTSAVK